jgi:hypothetical protein
LKAAQMLCTVQKKARKASSILSTKHSACAGIAHRFRQHVPAWCRGALLALPPLGRALSRRTPAPLCPPEHGAAERPLIGAVLKQHYLKQGGKYLREEVGALPQVLRDCLKGGQRAGWSRRA